jgi:hypothetical protein
MEKIFTHDECETIKKDPYNIIYINKIKDQIIKYLKNNDLFLINTNTMKYSVINNVNKNTNKWHYDDITLINYIVCIEGDGTIIKHNNEILQLSKGEGFPMIGEEGHAFLNLSPTLHRSPNTTDKRLLIRVILEPDFKINKIIEGNTNEYNSELYLLRMKNINLIM